MPAKRAHRFGGPALKKKQATEPAANDEQRHEAAAEEDKEKEKEEEGKEEEKEEKTGSEEADVKKPASGASSGGSGGAKGGREAIDIIFAFDTTMSMYPCLGEVRRNVSELVSRLFRELKGLRVGITAFADHDSGAAYDIKHQPLSTDEDAIVQFVSTVPATGSCSLEECYELALHEARHQPWRTEAVKTLVIIGDTYPHLPHDNPKHLDWQVEAQALSKQGITVYGVQCLFNGVRTSDNYRFFSGLAAATNGYHLFLDQFSYVRDLILAVCFKQLGDDNQRLAQYEKEVASRPSGLTNSMKRMFDTMLGREVEPVASYDSYDAEKVDEGPLRPCPPAKYQVLEVDDDVPIKKFVIDKSLTFKVHTYSHNELVPLPLLATRSSTATAEQRHNVVLLFAQSPLSVLCSSMFVQPGKGFYEFTKAEQISAKKLIVLMHKTTGELFEGAAARRIAGISDATASRKLKPTDVDEYRVFAQSTSYNRKLQKGTGFLYESDD